MRATCKLRLFGAKAKGWKRCLQTAHCMLYHEGEDEGEGTLRRVRLDL